jgi:hypothetical protein
MRLTSGRLAAFRIGQSDGPTFDGVLARAVTFRDDPHLAAELLGWHGREIIPVATAQARIADYRPKEDCEGTKNLRVRCRIVCQMSQARGVMYV